MMYGQFLAKGAGESSPPFWIMAVFLAVIVAGVFVARRARRAGERARRRFDGDRVDK